MCTSCGVWFAIILSCLCSVFSINTVVRAQEASSSHSPGESLGLSYPLILPSPYAPNCLLLCWSDNIFARFQSYSVALWGGIWTRSMSTLMRSPFGINLAHHSSSWSISFFVSPLNRWLFFLCCCHSWGARSETKFFPGNMECARACGHVVCSSSSAGWIAGNQSHIEITSSVNYWALLAAL